MKRENESDKPATATPLSETEYLAQQARLAKAAIAPALCSAVSHTAQGADPRRWAKSYPKTTVVATAAAAFAAVVLTTPSREEREMGKDSLLKRMKRYVTDAVKKAMPENATKAAPQHQGGTTKSIGKMIAKEIIDVGKPLLMSLITGYMSTHQHGHDGQSEAPQPQSSTSR